MAKYIFIKINDTEYDPPYNAEQIKKNYGIELYNKLKKDEVHRWRMETGIELIHKEPSKKELERIWKNWQLMSDDMKEKSDKKSIELFGVDNKTNYERLIKEYGINDMNRKCIICGRQTYNSSGICEKCWEHADEIDENDNLQDSQIKDDEHLDLSKYTYNTPVSGSCFITQEGKFIKAPGEYHADIIKFNEFKDYAKDFRDFDEKSFCEKTGLIRVNDGFVRYGEIFAMLPTANLNESQYKALEMYLDFVISNPKSEFITIYVLDCNAYKKYQINGIYGDNVDADYIMKRIRNCAKSHKLRDKIKND